jgi:hypothetical protein
MLATAEAVSMSKFFDDLPDAIDFPNWGSEGVWDDYSAHGVFVYDRKLNSGPYRRKRSPAKNTLSELLAQLRDLDSMPIFDVLYT